MLYGDYAEVYAANNVKNNNEERTTSAIALYPSNNAKGGCVFISLSTDRILHRKQWKKLPINNRIIDRVEELGDKERQGFVSSNFKYKWNRNNEENHYESDSVSSNKGRITDDMGEEGDEHIIISINEFHDIANDVNEMVADERTDDSDTIHSGVSQEDERSEQDTGNIDDPNGEPTPDEAPSNAKTEWENNVDDNSIVATPTVDETNTINDQSQSSKESGRHDEGESMKGRDEDQDENDDVETDIANQRYNLRARKNTNYKNLHRYNEVQLMRLQRN